MKKFFYSALSSLLVIIVIIILLIPTILSTKWGTEKLINHYENKYNAEISLKTLSLSWFNGQEMVGLDYQDKNLLLKLNYLKTDSSLFKIIFGKVNVGNMVVDAPTVVYYHVPKMPLEAKKSSHQKKKRSIKHFVGDLIVRNGFFKIEQTDSDSIQFDHVSLELNIPSSTFPLLFSTSGKTLQNQIRGEFDIKAEVSDQEGDLSYKAMATVSHFPVEGIDQLNALFNPGMKGMLKEALGESLDLHLSTDFVENRLISQVDLNSSNLKGEFELVYENNAFSLLKPVDISWNISPYLFEKDEFPVHLADPVRMGILLERFTIPVENPKSLSILATMTAPQVTLGYGQDETLTFSSVRLKLSTDQLMQDLGVSFQSDRGDFALNILDLSSKTHYENLSINMEALPSSLLDALLKQEGRLTPIIGKEANIKLEQNDKNYQLNFVSTHLSLRSFQFKLNDGILITSPAPFTYSLTPELFASFSNPDLKLGKVALFEGEIRKFNLPFKTMVPKDLSLKFSSKFLDFDQLFTLGPVQITDFKTTFKNYDIKSQGQLFFEDKKNLFAGLLGQSLQAKLNAKLNLGNDQTWDIPSLTLFLDGDKFHSAITGSLDQNGVLNVKKPLPINLTLTPDEINPILAKQEYAFLLAEPTRLKGEIKPGLFPLKEMQLSSLQVSGTATMENLLLISPDQSHKIPFQEVELSLNLDGKRERGSLDLKGDAKNSGFFELNLSTNELQKEFLSSPLKGFIKLNHFPSIVLDNFLDMHDELPLLIGPTTDLEVSFSSSGDTRYLKINNRSERLKLNGNFAINDTFRLYNAPLHLTWLMSDEGYEALLRLMQPEKAHGEGVAFSILKPSELTLKITKLSYPISDKPFNLYHAVCAADVEIDQLSLKDKESDFTAKLSKLSGSIDKGAGNDPLTFSLDGKTIFGGIEMEGTLQNYITENGELDFSNLTSIIETKLNKVPTILLDAFFNLKAFRRSLPSSVLGPKINATLNSNIKNSKGPLNIKIEATDCRATLDGMVYDGILYLEKPLLATLNITPKLAELFLKEMEIEFVQANNPLIFRINQEGFAFPLEDFSIDRVNIDWATLDIGQIVCQNRGNPSQVGGIFKLDLDDRNMISLWFAPLDFRLAGGIMMIERTEILYNKSYQIATWGDVDFNRSYVDMIVGLTAQSLQSTLGIAGLPPEYVLQVPLKGPFGNVKLAKSEAVAKIAVLIAREQGKQVGGIWGGVIGALGSLADDQSSVPPPKRPFPWE